MAISNCYKPFQQLRSDCPEPRSISRSCPPLDALLSKIGSSTGHVLPLAYHVDYWNHLGWADTFSSHEFSARQSAYSSAMDLGGESRPYRKLKPET